MASVSLQRKFRNINSRLLKSGFPSTSVLVLHNSFLSRIHQKKEYLEPVSSELNKNDNVDSDVIKYYKDSQIIYSSYIEDRKIHLPYDLKMKFQSKIAHQDKRKVYKFSVPLVIEKMYGENFPKIAKKEISLVKDSTSTEVNFPFTKFEKITDENLKRETLEDPDLLSNFELTVKEDINSRLNRFNENILQPSPSKILTSKFLTSNTYEDTLISNLSEDPEENVPQGLQYGTANPDIPKSTVPCGGCGAILHCQDEGLPGYFPSELFVGLSNPKLRAILCQRCFFLKRHKIALNVRVSPEVYEQALQPITDKKALVIVVVDILDVPCSIWPGIFKLLGNMRPVVVVGNKVDLLPSDGPRYLDTIKESLTNALRGTSLWKTNIRHICLTSAKTGFGIESLISRVQASWGNKGDIYIVGCTNAGKSSLFNALLGSDMCQVKASDLIRRATASPWPGTTLNLLKFPILPPSGELVLKRIHRLSEQTKQKVDNDFKRPSKYTPSTLTGHIGRTLQGKLNRDEATDPFAIDALTLKQEDPPTVGINEKSKLYRYSQWCYDTPGTVQPDQLLSLLTHDELLKVLPKRIINPKTYSLYNGHSLFIGGLTRLDVLYASSSIRLTVYASHSVPVTIVKTVDASSLYRKYLGSELFAVPSGSDERLSRWPVLKPTNISVVGKGTIISSADIVLSSAGFITVTSEENEEVELRGWTPGGRGVYIRDPPLLPSAIKFKGKRIRGTPAFNRHRMHNPKDAMVN